jgi:hypothetical protein
MKKFINDPDNLTPELLEGYCSAHADQVTLVSDKIVMRAQPKDQSKVAIVTLGGAGHEPALSGFVGEGIPADRQAVGGIPERGPVPADAPLFMGFRSGFRKNQATEDDVTIESGLFAGGTTMHVSRMRLRLDSWYDLLDDEQRVARMFSPLTATADVAQLGIEAPSHADELSQSARTEGHIGHLQATATARRDGRPLILRRDFNTTDGGQAGLHFVSLQRSVDDFNSTRRAMNAAATASETAGIDARTNNGINEFILVTNRANYLVPPSPLRAFPYLGS